MTLRELKEFDGREGNKAYVAVNGRIYDVTTSPLWAGGSHQDAHQAGADLTEELRSAPHVRAVIERFPVVGTLETETPAAGKPLWPWLLAGGVLIGVFIWLLV